MRVCFIAFFCFTMRSSRASECQVSPWSSWSICFGDCSYAQAVRNRDVLKPALPEQADDKGFFSGMCPHLYESKHCKQNGCNEIQQLVNSIPGQEHLSKSHIFRSTLLKNLEEQDRDDFPIITSEISHVNETILTEVEMMDTEQRALNKSDKFKLEDIIHAEKLEKANGVYNETSANSFPDNENNITTFIKNNLPEFDSSPLKAIKTLTFIPTTISSAQADSIHGDTSTIVNFYIKSAVKENLPTNPEYFVNSLTVNIPQHLKPARERQSKIRDNVSILQHPSEENDPIMTTESPINEVLKELESTANQNIHLDDKHIKQALKKNKKLMRALVEAYKRRNLATTLSTDPQKELWNDEITTASQVEIVESSTKLELSRVEATTTSNEKDVVPSVITIAAPTGIQIQNKTMKSREATKMKNDEVVVFKTVDGTVLAKAPIQNSTVQSTDTVTLVPDIRLNRTKSTKSSQSIGSKNDSTAKAPTNFPIAFSDSNNTEIAPTTVTAQYWPRKGYVPNTRKHASEITSKLYMTHEIVQALSEEPVRRSPVLRLDCLENRRCCKIVRTECADGTEPKYMKRYYRPRGSSICLAYHYPRCSQSEEMEEQPIHFEQNCQDLCFNGSEKRIAPLLTLPTEN